MKKTLIFTMVIIALLLVGCAKTSTVEKPGTTSDSTVKVAPAEVEKKDLKSAAAKYCKNADDCKPVGCECTCNGCGGFSYEDVFNKEYEDLWYKENDCTKPTKCPDVCCQKVVKVCDDNVCKVVKAPTKKIIIQD